MTKKNILKLRKRTTKFNSYSDVVSAMTEADVAEGEVIVGYYEEDGQDHTVLGLGGPSGNTKSYFIDGKAVTEYVDAQIGEIGEVLDILNGETEE